MISDLEQGIVFAFARGESGGNPSYVVASAGERRQMRDACLAIAAQRHCEVTHVHYGETADQAEVRFYTESGAISFCGHGTLAAAAWMARAGRARRKLRLDHGDGSVDLTISEDGLRIGYAEQARTTRMVELDAALMDDIRRMLGLPALEEKDTRLWIGGNLRLKGLLQLASPAMLFQMKLEPEARDQFCHQLQITGIYPYVDLGGGRIQSRHFPLGSAHHEDMATGNIAATVAQHVLCGKGKLTIEQGGPACDAARLLVEGAEDGWQVSGECRFVSS